MQAVITFVALTPLTIELQQFLQAAHLMRDLP